MVNHTSGQEEFKSYLFFESFVFWPAIANGRRAG
jgi:hypothetical protein